MTSPTLQRQDLQSLHRLLPLQQGMLFHDLASPGRQPYFRQLAFRLEGPLDPGLFERSWNELMARHDALRSGFDYESAAQPLRLVWKQRRVAFSHADLTGLTAAEQAVRIGQYREQDRRRGFDLRRDVLVRVALFQLGLGRFELVWSWPHLLLDGWSGSVLFQEFHQIYGDLREHRPPALPPVPPHAAYADWLAAQDTDAARAHWRQTLAGVERAAGVPRLLPATRAGYEPGDHGFALDLEQTAALGQLASRQDATLATVVATLWGVLLGRLNDREDVVFGSVVAGRPPEVAGIERMVGLFLNTVPLRVRWRGDQTFAGLVREVQRAVLANLRHEHLSLVEIQAESGLRQDLFDHALVFENYPDLPAGPAAAFAALALEGHEATNYDFGVLVLPGPATRVRFSYNRAVHPDRQMQRLETHFRRLLDQVLRNDQVRLDDLNLLAPGEPAGRLGPARPQPPEATLTALWAAQVARTPEAIALVVGDRQWTYAEVDHRARQVAAALQTRLGLGLEDRVGVLMDRGEGRIFALLGILQAGCAYWPLSATCPEPLLRFLLADSGCRAVLGDAAGVSRVEAVAPGLGLELPATGPGAGPAAGISAGTLAYLIYTSGSTGRPKGVLIEHGGFVNMILDQIRGFGITPADRVLQFASASFDASLSEIFMALLAGARLVLLDDATRRDRARFLALLSREAITVATLPPSYLRALDRPDLSGLRVLITAGEPPDAADLRHYASRLRYFNAYGPTEAAVCAAFHEVGPDPEAQAVPLGRPVANSGLRILDQRLQPVPWGIAGEICLTGPGLARGYLNRPELTASRFVQTPDAAGGRLYRTGDRGCQREDGEIVFLGRCDAQFKFHGFRIEPGEIEQALRDHLGIAQAAVALRGATPETRQLVAYYVADRPVTAAQLREHLGRQLQPQLIPAVFVALAELPRTPAGKLDRAALPDPAPALEAAGERDLTAWTESQQAIAKVFQEVLGRAEVGLHDRFLDLGGDSLKAILAVGRMRRLGLELSLGDLTRLGTVAGLAAAAQAPAATQGAWVPATGPAPLTPIQQRYFQQQGPAGCPSLSHALLLSRPGALKAAPLAKAVAALWVHHDGLRMGFRPGSDGAWSQTCGPAGPGFELETWDLRTTPEPWAVLGARAEALQASFALATGPLFKAVRCLLAEGDHLLLVAHHLVVDAVSWRILLEDLDQAYAQAANGHPIQLPAKTAATPEWAQALRAWSRSEAVLAQKAHWNAVDAEPGAELVTDFPAAPHRYGDTAVLTLEVPAPLPQGADTDLQAVLLTALGRALGPWTGNSGLRVLLAGQGRIPLGPVEVSRTVGWFTAAYPVLLPAGDPVSLAAVRRILAAVPTQGAGYGVLKYLTPEALKADLRLAEEPEIALNYLGRFEPPAAGGFQPSDRLPGASGAGLLRTQKLEFDAMLDPRGLRITLRYCPTLHRAETLAALGRAFTAELRCVWGEALATSPAPLEVP